MLRYLLDTNICIYVIKRRPEALLHRFNEHAAYLAISTISFAELLHGAEKSSRSQQSLVVVEDFCSRIQLLSYGVKAAYHYGQIRASLELRGKTIGVNDLHISAHARSEGLCLVTNNLKEFERVDGLLTENWV